MKAGPLSDQYDEDDIPQDEPSLAKTLDTLNEEMGGEPGWPGLNTQKLEDKARERMRLDNLNAMRHGKLLREVLWDNPRGREVLEWLFDRTLRRRTWANPMIDPQMLMALGIWNEAQNTLVWDILDAIAKAGNVDLRPRSEP